MSTSRYPNQFKVRGSGSPNIISLGVAPRSLARSHAWSFAAWLVAYTGDMPAFLNVLIDVWVSRYGIDQTPEWLFQLNPGWQPYDPPARAAPPVAVRAETSAPLPTPIAAPRQGSSGAPPSRFSLPDGTPLDADAVRGIGEDAARTIAAGSGSGAASGSGSGARAPTSLPGSGSGARAPTSLPKPIIDVAPEGGSDGE